MNKTIDALNIYLADLNVFYRKVQNYHWNVVGQGFFTVHAKLEEIYDAVNEKIDIIAERVLSIGGRPYGSMKKYLEVTTITEAKDEDITVKELLNVLIVDVENLLGQVKNLKNITDEEGDFGTSAELDNHIAEYEKLLWMFKAYIK
ncbi:Dps family protein [Streptobacillus moniliformis]|uniref:Ferritin Dps family protein n=1 Tax=Streptobacillus moniliformis (strain ATCC 14647 / DSM 12112 / NCTC 10651 / 9901) TaxID=519441 RepID=D1AYC1_STRM9|nr:DNA starvation/stationary phase protection protein [Streptobacillus moniliformis]ACZ01297.1 Ferritin Dps family protein [Streptobacillus moniliformis DSM 12112]AVL43681.1 DNA starvation/stationary phase protection protein [Streptobacillus moniliformis]QXW66035.1 DNA starvation/stationary phase protection protein [Streptobacillus moniliformis]SQA13545.1 DNA starvation/stationary phase protection protein Dps [Streptobacillus moniliformis]